MNAYANHVVSYLFAQSWQIAVLAGIVGLISLALRNRSAHLRYLLWLIVLVKCLVPPLLTVPLAVLPERSSSPSFAGVVMPEEHSAPETPVAAGSVTQPQELRPTVPTVRAWIALVWGAGAFLFLLWVGGRAVRYTSWLRDRRRPLPPALQESIRELSEGFKFRKWPRIWLLEDISQPFVWGVLRGSVYLPAAFAGLSGSDRQRSILAHELSHIARFDAGVNLLQVLAQAAYWFHPFVWWANRKIRQEREKCCDEMAVAHLRTPPEHYTGAIVEALAAERRSAHPIPSLAIVGSVRDIEERIKTMLKPGKTFRTRPSLVAATVALLIALATIPTALVLTARGQAQPTTQNTNQPTTQLPKQLAGTSEYGMQPRFAARTFNSKVELDVWVQEMFPPTEKKIGRTPSATPLQIPACWLWGVRISAPVKNWDLLGQELSRNEVPGLILAADDSDLKQLAGLAKLRLLNLENSKITDASLEYLKGMSQLEQLWLGRAPITDAGLEHLKGMTGLQILLLESTPITDAGLRHLEGMTGLRILDLQGTRITDKGMEYLKGMTGMMVLRLIDTQTTDTGLEYLKGMTSLRFLLLRGTKIADAGMEPINHLTSLRYLFLGGTQITDKGLEHLKGMTGLRGLDLQNTQITDKGMEYLKGMTQLRQFLLLDSTKITDAGLEHTKGMTQLKLLSVSGTQVTDAGVQQLKQNLPKLTISR